MLKRAAVRLPLAFALVAAGLTAPSAQDRAATGEIPRLAFEKYTLPNGLEVILSRDTRLPMVAVNLWYHVGPANEEPGRTGFAHLFEHMMFQGSKHVPPRLALPAARGRRRERHQRHDRLRPHQLLRDACRRTSSSWRCGSNRIAWATCSTRSIRRALPNQQDVVRNERRQSVENRAVRHRRGSARPQLSIRKAHPYYGNVIGSHADIQAAKLDDVKHFFKRYYAPNNASLAIVGDFDTAQAKALVEKYFGTLKRGAAGAADQGGDADDHGRAPRGRARSRRAAARLHGVADAADLQAGRRRGRHRRQHPRRRPVEPAVQEARLREADRAGRRRRRSSR